MNTRYAIIKLIFDPAKGFTKKTLRQVFTSEELARSVAEKKNADVKNHKSIIMYRYAAA